MSTRQNEYKKALAIGKLGFWEWNAITNVTYWGDEKFQLFGYEPQEFEMTFDNAFKTMHPGDVERVLALLQQKMLTEHSFDYEYRGLHKNGSILNIWVRVEVIRDDNSRAIGLSGISQDITDRKQLEEKITKMNVSLEDIIEQRTKELQLKIRENELLVKEMHHRVKNNLQVISSILRLQSDYLEDTLAVTSLEECVSRIKSMALIHESLYSKNNLSSIDVKLYFQQLLDYHIHEEHNIKTVLKLPELLMDIEKMIPLGMIVNELVSNSLKHAFVSATDPTILLDIEQKGGGISVSYKDNGKGFNIFEPRTKASFGLDLINTLFDDLQTEPEFPILEKGFGIDFSIKL
ncbi:MAG TPA: histidine kinase dimerization/phosphoacceptor domain -containing protein [Bacteroidia bacterium]